MKITNCKQRKLTLINYIWAHLYYEETFGSFVLIFKPRLTFERKLKAAFTVCALAVQERYN